ncbi:DUF3500 domain-containing protein [Streptomyces sp. NPDC093544]|uniref:DUF3500 domain-containing protein n=1 Tax=Streptomyces sp. NPDC093544 TaxID=3155200 RepID=UPI00343247BF
MPEKESGQGSYRGFGARPAGLLPLSRGLLDAAALSSRHQALLPPVPRAAEEAFVGITADGNVVPDLFALRDTGWSPEPAAKAALSFLDSLTPVQRNAVLFEIDANQWRMWVNAFPTWDPHGLRLEDFEPGQRDRALTIIEACLSASGFADTRAAMKLNAALGELIDQYRDTLTEFCYFFALFGTPSATEPWGWQLWGHHLDVSCFILGRQMVLTPTFMGAEPVAADRGTYEGTRLFDAQRQAGLELRRSLRPEQARLAVLYGSMRSQDLPEDLADPVDGRHRAGAGRDNRVIPYEGLSADRLTSGQQELLLHLVGTYAHRMPTGPSAALLKDVQRHLDDTHIAWIGAAGEEDAFYYRVHNPVLLIEYDCHQGVFLNNTQPEPFHVHTIVRTPNGGDYGRDLLGRHLARHHRQPISPSRYSGG